MLARDLAPKETKWGLKHEKFTFGPAVSYRRVVIYDINASRPISVVSECASPPIAGPR